jgi:hypothetical protein
MFEYNKINNIITEDFLDSKIYTVDNFFVNPDEIVNYLELEANQPNLHKIWEMPTHNSFHFFEGRHFIEHENILEIQKKLISICGSKSDAHNTIYSNIAKFYDKDFNDYQNHYWWPHRDFGWNAIIYLNDMDTEGTNLYEETSNDQQFIIENQIKEHCEPWRKKEKYKIIKTIQAKYNRLVLFDGKRFLHNMAINNDAFFHQKRMNLATFFGQ